MIFLTLLLLVLSFSLWRLRETSLLAGVGLGIAFMS
jgi:hypothetical protein